MSYFDIRWCVLVQHRYVLERTVDGISVAACQALVAVVVVVGDGVVVAAASVQHSWLFAFAVCTECYHLQCLECCVYLH